MMEVRPAGRIPQAISLGGQMIVSVGQVWEILAQLPDGRMVRSVDVHGDSRVIGRLVDLGTGLFRADYVSVEGDICEDVLPDYYAALQRVTEEALMRKRTLH